MIAESVDVSIIIPVFNKLAFTRQCLDRIARAAGGGPAFEVVIVDNGSRDGTAEFFAGTPDFGCPVRYLGNEDNLGFSRANNLGARQSEARYLLFLNNDTLVVPGWLEAMVEVAQSDPRVGVVGIKQLFPYTNRIHHTGIIFTADRRPQHLYPHADGSLSHVNKEREYQAVTGSCLLIPRDLFTACGMFDEGYRNGYEDVDLCLAVRRQGRSVVCCTRSFIYHYGQISETRTADDDRNAERLLAKWAGTIRPDEHEYFRQDRREIEHARPSDRQTGAGRTVPRDLVYFADDLSVGSALSWVTLELIHALDRLGVPVALRQADLSRATDARRRRRFESLMRVEAPVGGVQIRWSHYWPQHLNLDLHGRLNAELFVINYLFDRPGAEPWDYWLQCVGHNGYRKLALSGFCREVLQAAGVPPAACHLVQPGYSPEVLDVAPPSRRPSGLRFLTVTNSHDLDRYGTSRLLEAYWSAFSRRDDVTLIVKDYGTSSGDTSLRDLIRRRTDAAAVEYIGEFTSKAALIALYKSCDAFVSAHRGEGYGMKILDALACGLPVVTPLFGGPTDFCTPSNCLPVDFTLTPVTAGLDARSLRLTNGPMWAEPSAASLAQRLREIADDPAGARALGARARADVLDRFTWDAAARQLLEAVSAEDAPPRAALPAAAAPRPAARRGLAVLARLPRERGHPDAQPQRHAPHVPPGPRAAVHPASGIRGHRRRRRVHGRDAGDARIRVVPVRADGPASAAFGAGDRPQPRGRARPG